VAAQVVAWPEQMASNLTHAENGLLASNDIVLERADYVVQSLALGIRTGTMFEY
jgi:hypothetical protein